MKTPNEALLGAAIILALVALLALTACAASRDPLPATPWGALNPYRKTAI